MRCGHQIIHNSINISSSYSDTRFQVTRLTLYLPGVCMRMCKQQIASLSDINKLQMYRNFIKSGSHFLVTTTFPSLPGNTQLYLPGHRKQITMTNTKYFLTSYIFTPRFHEVNLSLPPFTFPAPICQAEDATPTQFFALWRMSRLEIIKQRPFPL